MVRSPGFTRLRIFTRLLPLFFVAWERSAAAAPVSFNREIRPILSDNCFACHGFDSRKRKAGLRLDVAEDAFKPGKEGRTAIKPGDLAASELWRRITTSDPDDLMPPPESHKSLSAEQRELFKRWIEEGAHYQKHWAFEPPIKTPPPGLAAPTVRTKAAVAPRNPVDGFIHASVERAGLTPSPEADRATLIRRVAFDLTGLPPTPAEVDAFVADTGADAYERLVDRLLDSPAYGEQMGRHWLDVARYADTHGLHLDNERQMWAYRDWVVRAFNRNLPFDRFTIEQLAGDLLPEPTQEQLVATGFNRCNVTTGEGGAIDAEFIFRYAVDRTATTVQAWMGLTAGCAVCHDHKYDPLSQREFYSLYAFFHSAADPAMDGNVLLTPPIMKLNTRQDVEMLARLDSQIKDSEARIPEALAKVSYTDPATLTPLPPASEVQEVWADDDVPPGWRITASPGAPTQFVTATEGQVASGQRALKRQDKGLAQDVFQVGSTPLEIPQGARLYAHVYLDPADPPKTIMLQYMTADWKHRAVWGDYDAIDWGTKGTTERVNLGPLPKAGEWVQLEFDGSKVGLKLGDKINGFALTQFGGTVFWDKVGVTGRVDPANDARRSFLAWSKQYEGKEEKQLPEDVRKIFKDVASTNRTPEQVTKLRDHYLANACLETKPIFEPLQAELAAARKRRDDYETAIPATYIWRDLDQSRESFVMARGAYDKPGDRVSRGVPAVLPALKTSRQKLATGSIASAGEDSTAASAAGSQPTRLDFAQWLVSDEHPLTARVTVNRFWQQFFGTGLVKTSGDFGSQGEPPSHPELLDWLAVTFRESGWDVKRLVKLLVTSSTYRQSSKSTPELLKRDPENRLLARGPRFRLDAEQIRDNALFVSGLLSPRIGGRGVRPYQPPNIWEPVGYTDSNTRNYRQDSGEALYRRSLYTFYKRTAPPPALATFDVPNREQFCTRRERSDTPLQALQLMNDVQHFEAARALAARILVEGGSTPEERIVSIFRMVVGRRPEASELAVVRDAFESHLVKYSTDAAAAKAAVHNGESKPPSGLSEPELAAWTLVANLVLNLDETITRN